MRYDFSAKVRANPEGLPPHEAISERHPEYVGGELLVLGLIQGVEETSSAVVVASLALHKAVRSLMAELGNPPSTDWTERIVAEVGRALQTEVPDEQAAVAVALVHRELVYVAAAGGVHVFLMRLGQIYDLVSVAAPPLGRGRVESQGFLADLEKGDWLIVADRAIVEALGPVDLAGKARAYRTADGMLEKLLSTEGCGGAAVLHAATLPISSPTLPTITPRMVIAALVVVVVILGVYQLTKCDRTPRSPSAHTQKSLPPPAPVKPVVYLADGELWVFEVVMEANVPSVSSNKPISVRQVYGDSGPGKITESTFAARLDASLAESSDVPASGIRVRVRRKGEGFTVAHVGGKFPIFLDGKRLGPKQSVTGKFGKQPTKISWFLDTGRHETASVSFGPTL